MTRSPLSLIFAALVLVWAGCENPTTKLTDQPGSPAISTLAIPGVTAPARGSVPDVTAINTTQYTGTITWSPADSPFAASKVYTATVVLTPKTGFTLTGVAANAFTIAGTTATNAANSGTVTAVFPATGAAAVTPASDKTSTNIGTLKAIPTGTFQRDATTTNLTTISTPFWMSEKEITRAQFLAILGADPSDTTRSSGTSDPAQMVNWYRAIAFCNKLSLDEGLTPVYSVTGVNFSSLAYASIPTIANSDWDAVTVAWTNNGYRLPTEMEWMWAAMGADVANPGAVNRGHDKAFAGSTGANLIGNYVWYTLNTLTNKTSPVGTKTANEIGLYDMSGNVWEWCWDWYAPSETGALTDNRGPSTGTYRVVRGGDWRNVASYATVAYRDSSPQHTSNDGRGFRVVRQ